MGEKGGTIFEGEAASKLCTMRRLKKWLVEVLPDLENSDEPQKDWGMLEPGSSCDQVKSECMGPHTLAQSPIILICMFLNCEKMQQLPVKIHRENMQTILL